MTPEQRKIAQQVVQALAETIKECPDGAPLGPMYMAFQQRGMSLEVFEHLINTMVSLGLIEVKNHQAKWIAGSLH